MTPPRHIVLVGAGLAAQRCCQALRGRGHDGRVTLVGDERVDVRLGARIERFGRAARPSCP